jgi:diguanylate cyclase (GGDEF)-like protein
MGRALGTSTGNAGRSTWRRIAGAAVSLQFRATILVVVLTLAVTAAVSAFILQQSRHLAEQQHDAQLVQAAGLLAKAAAVTLANENQAALQALAEGSADGMPLLYVIISSRDGTQLALAEHRNNHVLRWIGQPGARRVPVPGTPTFVGGEESAPVLLDVTFPITHRDPAASTSTPAKLLGYVRTGMVADTWHRTMSSQLDLVIGIGVLAALVVVPLGFVLVRRIVAPLDRLSNVMLQFSEGKLDARCPVRHTDEIGRLARAFNDMADHHQRTHERIVRLNAELEERVAYRTQQLRDIASRDPLTGLFNRRQFNEVLSRRFSEAMRYSADLSCMMIDLDEFKAANDEFGHQTGDDLLVLSASTISSQLRAADMASRYGGDEFVVLLPQTDTDRAQVLAERIVERFKRELAVRFPGLTVSMSVGVASLHSLDVGDADALVRAADDALYQAKARGKNRIVTAAEQSNPTRT